MAAVASQNRYAGGPSPSGLADVLDLILDKGLVIDIYLRVSLVGIELLTVDARIVVASVDTYLRFAEAVGRLSIESDSKQEGLPELIKDLQHDGAKSKTSGALEGAKEKISDVFSGDDEEDEGREREREPARRRPRRSKRREEDGE
jgi:gas vesicle structural protein